jgi:membrane protein DedA with SNARE-associated domain
MQSCWPYLIIIGTLFFTGIGLPPLPEELPILAAGVTASKSDLQWYFAWPACVVGILAADLTLYAIGRFGGSGLFQTRWVQMLISPERHRRLQAGFHRHGLSILLTGRLLPGLRTGVFLTAGAVHYPFWRFLIADALYALPGVALVFFGSYFLAETFSQWVAEVDRIRHWIVCAVVAMGLGYLLWKVVRCWIVPRRETTAPETEPAIVGVRLRYPRGSKARPAA